jgi:lysophospholipase L1-like esterase
MIAIEPIIGAIHPISPTRLPPPPRLTPPHLRKKANDYYNPAQPAEPEPAYRTFQPPPQGAQPPTAPLETGYLLTVIWTLLAGALGAPPDLDDLRRQAAQLDLRRSTSSAALDTLAGPITTPPPSWSNRIKQAPLPPGERQFLLRTLAHTDTPCTPDRALPLQAQIDRVRLCAGQPRALTPLLATFARSRLGDLPEDPDLFERALREAIKVAPLADVSAALDALATTLQPLLEDRLRNYVSSAQARALVDPEHRAEAEALLRDALQQQHTRHGLRLLSAMQTEQGSHLEALLSQVERALGVDWAASPDPVLASIGLTILDRIGEPAEDTSELPQDPPGQWPGTSPTSPHEPADRAWSHPDSSRLPDGGLLGLGLLLGFGALLVGTRLPRARRLAAASLGLSVIFGSEGVLRLADVTPLAQRWPLFTFTDWTFDVFTLDETGALASTEGGWIRQQTLRTDRPTFRAVTLGASSAHGSNHLIEETFSALLEDRLRARWPEEAIEVLNLGVGGTTSNGVLHVGRAALDLGADLLLIYYGHNEVAQFTQLSVYPHIRPGRLAWRVWLGHSRLYSLLAQLLLPDTSPMVSADESVFTDGSPSPDQIDTLKQLAVDNLRYNLDQLLNDARRAGCEVILMDVATNYRFVDLTPLSTADTSELDAARAARGRGDAGAALAAAQAVMAEAVPGSKAHLEAAVLTSELLAASGEGAAARAAVQVAVDASARPGVATRGVRQVITALSQRHGAPRLDVDRLFYARSPDGLSAPGLFWDDLHPTRWGHQLIAEALYPEVAAAVEERLER